MPKTSSSPASELWKQEPDAHDFPAALDYLTLVASPEIAERLVQKLEHAETQHRKAKDLLRASQLALLPVDNPHVKSDLRSAASAATLRKATSLAGHCQLEA